jgi:hypothetical protein
MARWDRARGSIGASPHQQATPTRDDSFGRRAPCVVRCCSGLSTATPERAEGTETNGKRRGRALTWSLAIRSHATCTAAHTPPGACAGEAMGGRRSRAHDPRPRGARDLGSRLEPEGRGAQRERRRGRSRTRAWDFGDWRTGSERVVVTVRFSKPLAQRLLVVTASEDISVCSDEEGIAATQHVQAKGCGTPRGDAALRVVLG